MNIDELSIEIKKLKYQVGIIIETIDYEAHPVESLILSMNWGEGDIDRAHDIFEKYDNKIEEEKTINWIEFELELKSEFNIGYQTVKSIVNAFYRNHQWTNVCYGYAMSLEPRTPIEFHHITRNVE